MRAPTNRRVFVVGYGAATPLGATFEQTWTRAAAGEAGFGKVSRCSVDSPCDVVGEIPDWAPVRHPLFTEKDAYNWNASFVLLTVAVCAEALQDARLEMTPETGPRTACLVGSSLNGHDAFRIAQEALATQGPKRVSPYLLPNLCANLPSGRASMQLGFTGPIFSPQGACASGNYAIGAGARMIRDGDCDFVLAGGVDTPILPEIIHGFANMGATLKVKAKDRAYEDPSQASRPFSADRKGFILSEGAGVVVLAAEDRVEALGLEPRAEVLGVGWTSDAFHFTRPNPPTIIRAIQQALWDADVQPEDIDLVSTHGTSTPRGDRAELECLDEVFGEGLQRTAVTSNKSQMGHTLGGAAAIEAALAIEGMRRGVMLPTINYQPDPKLPEADIVANEARSQAHELVLSDAFGFGGTNCCVVLKGM